MASATSRTCWIWYIWFALIYGYRYLIGNRKSADQHKHWGCGCFSPTITPEEPNIFSVYLPYVEETGISSAAGSSLISIRCFSSFFSLLFVNRYYSHLSLRKGIVGAMLMCEAGYLFYAVGGSYVIYTIGAILTGAAYAFGSTYPVSILISNWFRDKKGFALGISQAGSGLALVFFSPLIAAWVKRYGLRNAFIMQVAFMGVCTMIVALLLRSDPEDMGLLPYGFGKLTENRHTDRDRPDYLPRAAMILMCAAMFLIGGVGVAFTGHLSILMRSTGYSPEEAAYVVSVFGTTLIFTKVLFGTAADRMGTIKATLLIISMFLAGCAISKSLLQPVHTIGFLIAVLLGIGGPAFNMGPSLWLYDLVSRRRYSDTLKWMQLFISLGSIILTAVPGMIAGRTGEYITSYYMFGVFAGTAILIVIIVYHILGVFCLLKTEPGYKGTKKKSMTR